MSKCLAKLGSFKVSKVAGEKNGQAYEFYTIERSYKDKTEEWKSERVIVRPAEMVLVAELLNIACSEVIKEQTEAQNERFSTASPQVGFTTDISDEIPF